MFIRVIGVALSVMALWWSSSSFGLGLGLGELNVSSYLASPLKARVTLRGMDGIDLDPGQFSIHIDSDSQAKIEYRLLRMDSDTAIIDLYTRDIISEPLFQFRIEVKWDSSAVARSYDVLIDPPAYIEYANIVGKVDSSTAPVDSASTQVVPESAQQEVLQSQSKPIALGKADSSITTQADEPVSNVALSVLIEGGVEVRREYGPTINGNSIWRVARAVAPDNGELTIYQWMYAIWGSNPHAFTRDNMHRLNMDEVLEIPLEHEVAEATHSEAWRAYSSQMALLQSPVVSATDTARIEIVEAAQEQTAQEGVQSTDDQLVSDMSQEFAEPAVSTSAIKTEALDETRPQAALELESLATDDAIVVLLEESPSAMDENAVLIGESASPVTSEEVVSIEAEPAGIVTGESLLDVQVPLDSQLEESVPAIVELNDAEVLADAPESAIGRTLPLDEQGTAVDTAAVVEGWPAALLVRHEFVDQLPVIGTEGSLAVIGRLVKRTDRIIATSPSWATTAFGILLVIVLMMFIKKIVSRRAAARAMPLPAAAAVRSEPAAVSDKAVSTEKAVAVEQTVSSEQPASTEEASVKRRKHRRYDPSLEIHSGDSNSDEIIAQADSILDQGDADEAIKLMRLAVELQPNQAKLVTHLLELYHETRQARAFDDLLDQSRQLLESLDPSEQIHLRVMHTRLCPDSLFPIEVKTEASLYIELQSEEVPEAESASADDNLFAQDESAAADPVDSELGPEPAITNDDLKDYSSNQDGMLAETIDDAESTQQGDELVDKIHAETQVMFTNNGVPLREKSAPIPGMDDENLDLDVILKEADVYLAYGLYDNAEELLLKGMEEDPERADFLSRLLDTYYATRNIVDFVSSAEVMLNMDDAGGEYWDKIEIMGFELAPHNKMFAAGKDKSLSAIELEIPRPETADFDFSNIQMDEGATLDDIEIDGDVAVDFLATNLNIDLGAGELVDALDDEVDHSLTEFKDFADLEASDPIDDEPDLDLNLEATDETFEFSYEATDETFEISYEATDDGLDAALEGSLEEAEIELEAELSQDTDVDKDSIDPDHDQHDADEEVIQFTMDEDIESDPAASTNDDDASLVLVDEPTLDPQVGVSLDAGNSRILHFPDSPKETRNMDEFESEVKMTLQSIRDQLQNMTERMFQQERATNDLQQTIAELSDETKASKAGKKNSSS